MDMLDMQLTLRCRIMEPLNSEVYEELKQATPTVKYYFLYHEAKDNDNRNKTDLCINRERD